MCSFNAFRSVFMYFEVLLGCGGYPQTPHRHPVLSGVVVRLIFRDILETLRRILEPRGPHSRHFLARMSTKVVPMECKSSGARPECIFCSPRVEKVLVFRLANVAKVLYIMHGFDISLFLSEAASQGDLGSRNGPF